MRKIFPYVLSGFMVASFSQIAFAQSTADTPKRTEEGARSGNSRGAPDSANVGAGASADAPKPTEEGARSAQSTKNKNRDQARGKNQGADSAATGSTEKEKKY